MVRSSHRLFEQAKAEALKSKCGYRLGAVIINKKVCSQGRNRSKTHPIMHKYHRPNRLLGIHAEIDACLKLPAQHLIGADLYVCMIMMNGEHALAKPCEVCLEIMRRFKVGRVFYTIHDDEYGVIKL